MFLNDRRLRGVGPVRYSANRAVPVGSGREKLVSLSEARVVLGDPGGMNMKPGHTGAGLPKVGIHTHGTPSGALNPWGSRMNPPGKGKTRFFPGGSA